MDPSKPTEHKHGSTAKLDVLAARAARGLPLFHPGDKIDVINPPDGRRNPRYKTPHHISTIEGEI